MAELGLPRSWSEFMLRRVGCGSSLASVENDVHFCLERGGDMERLIADEREKERLLQGSSRSLRDRWRGTSSKSESFAGHCQSDRGDGFGDGLSSWAFN